MDERECICTRQRLVTRMSERESRSSDKNVKGVVQKLRSALGGEGGCGEVL